MSQFCPLSIWSSRLSPCVKDHCYRGLIKFQNRKINLCDLQALCDCRFGFESGITLMRACVRVHACVRAFTVDLWKLCCRGNMYGRSYVGWWIGLRRSG